MEGLLKMIEAAEAAVGVVVTDPARAARVQQALGAAVYWLTADEEPEEEQRA